MTIEDYQKNLRGVNNGADFSSEFLVRVQLAACQEVANLSFLSKIFMIRSEKEKLSCRRSILANLDLNMHGKSSLPAHAMLVCNLDVEAKYTSLIYLQVNL
jgi:hypothetical protein